MLKLDQLRQIQKRMLPSKRRNKIRKKRADFEDGLEEKQKIKK